MADDLFGPTLAPRELMAAGHTAEPVSYDRVYRGVISGKIPATRVDGRWMLRRSDLPAIAAALGLTPAAAQAA